MSEAALIARITDYLGNGGLFNPEQMDHHKVSQLLYDCRRALANVPAAPSDPYAKLEALRDKWRELEKGYEQSALVEKNGALQQLKIGYSTVQPSLSCERERENSETTLVRI